MTNANTFAESLVTRSTAAGRAVAVTVSEIEAADLDPRAVVANLRSVCAEDDGKGDFSGEGWRVQVWA